MPYFSLTLQVFEMSEDLEDREVMIDGRQFATPHLGDHLVSGARRLTHQAENLVTACLVMADGLGDPGAVSGKWVAM